MDFLSNFCVLDEPVMEVALQLVSNPLYVLRPLTTFKSENPIFFQIFLCILVTAYCYVQDKRSGVASRVDRLWSIAPIIFSVGLFVHYGFHHKSKSADANDIDGGDNNNAYPMHYRLLLCSILIFIWGSRLTYNLYIKGGYTGKFEDYRWAQIRTWFTGQPWKWHLFEFFFINIYQMISISFFSVLPLLIVYYGPTHIIYAFDVPCTLLFLSFLTIETMADHQMFRFQSLKRQKILDRNYSQIRDYEVKEGFYCSGLYKFSRHPNYFGELGQWWTIYLFGCITNLQFLNWTLIGALNLSLIFYKSTRFTEGLSSYKYPNYKYYAKKTSMVVPWFPSTDSRKQK